MQRKILLMSLPGAGKTTLARVLAPRLNAVLFNADEVRAHINKDLGFSEADRVEQARRMGWLTDQVVRAGGVAIADFICPTPDTRAAFLEGGKAFVVWLNRIESARFEDTNRMFIPPERADIVVEPEGTPEYWADQIVRRVRPIFNPKAPTALFIGRYQPFHEGHRALVIKGLNRVGQVCIAVRNTGGIDASNPLGLEDVRGRIEHSLREYEGRFSIVSVPNITHVFYGRDVGYVIEKIELDTALQAVSATEMRRRLGIT